MQYMARIPFRYVMWLKSPLLTFIRPAVLLAEDESFDGDNIENTQYLSGQGSGSASIKKVQMSHYKVFADSTFVFLVFTCNK